MCSGYVGDRRKPSLWNSRHEDSRPPAAAGYAASSAMARGAAAVASTSAIWSAGRRTRDGTTPPYGALPAVRLGSLAYTPHPQILRADGTGIDEFREDAFAAYTHALLWYVTPDARHARKAIECMAAWPAAWPTAWPAAWPTAWPAAWATAWPTTAVVACAI